MINVTVEGLLPLKRQMQLLMMPSGIRRRLLYRVAQRVMRDSRKRVRTKTNLDGGSFPDRLKPREKRRKHGGGKQILGGLVLGSDAFKVVKNDSVSAKIGWHGLAGMVAAKQQYGATETETKEGNIAKLRAKGKQYYDDPATKRQAKALRDLGFAPKGKRRTSNKDIMANMTVGQAGAIIRSMRSKQGQTPKQSWLTRLPARSFLGATAREVTDYINLIFEQITQGFKHGTR